MVGWLLGYRVTFTKKMHGAWGSPYSGSAEVAAGAELAKRDAGLPRHGLSVTSCHSLVEGDVFDVSAIQMHT